MMRDPTKSLLQKAMEEKKNRHPQTLRLLAVLGLIAALFAAFIMVVAGPGHRMGWWNPAVGYGLLGVGFLFAMAAISICAGALLFGWYLKIPDNRAIPLLGVILALGTIYIPYRWFLLTNQTPPIHDITTDLRNPPEFRSLASQRGVAENPTRYEGFATAELQREAYPGVQPLLTPIAPHALFDKVKAAVRDTGWAVSNIDDGAMTIEATDETFWFGFKDDVVLKVSSTPVGSRLDMRSQSREGNGGDAGTNARRIEQFLLAFEEELGN